MIHKVATLLLSLAFSLPAWASSADFTARPLAEGILMVSGPAGNTLVAVDNDGLVLVDGVPREHAREYLDFVYRETGVDNVKTLFNSHWHPEVTGLNALLGKEDVSIIAHENTRQWLATTIRKRGEKILHTPMVEHALPGETFYGEARIPFRDGTIEYGHLLQAHTDGDLYVRFPEQNILYTGDVVRSDGWAVVHEPTNGYMGGLMDGLATLEKRIDANTVIVPGSGPPMDKADFDAQHETYKTLMEEMVSLLREAKSAREVVAMDPASSLRPEWDNAEAFLDQGFRSFYAHLRDARHVGGMP